MCSEITAAIPSVREKLCAGCVRKILFGKRKFDSISSAQRNVTKLRNNRAPALNTKLTASDNAREIFARKLPCSRLRGFLPLLRGAYASTPTTIGRRFRHHKPRILWFLREFFLTSFPQPPILRFQARGSISWPQHFFAAPNQS